MNTYPIEFYDLLSRALGGNDSKRLQGFLDEVMALKYNKLEIDGFAFAPDMQLDFTYEQIQKELKMNVMAQYVDVDSPAIPYGSEGFQIGTGRIPRMKGVEYFNEDKLRKILITEQRFGASSDRVMEAAASNLFNTIDTLIGGHTNSMTYQRHQIVSAGKLTLTDKNNPYGIQNLTFASHVPAANINNLSGDKRWWTSVNSEGVYSSEGTKADPIADLKAIVKKAKDKGVRGHFEVEDSYMDQILEHSKIVAALAAKKFPLAADSATALTSVAFLSTAEKDAALAEIIGAPIKRIDSLVSVEKWDASAKKLVRPTFKAFEANVLVFVPDGKLGEILCVEPISVGGVQGSFYGGRLQVTVGVDTLKKCQGFYSEMTVLAVPDKPQYMWYIHPYSA